jgi:hypothetical protein
MGTSVSGLAPEEKYKPLDPCEKFRMATLDSFGRGTVPLGVLFAAEAHRQGILARFRTKIFKQRQIETGNG